MIIFVTGCAGFIGWKVCEFLLRRQEAIPGMAESHEELRAFISAHEVERSGKDKELSFRKQAFLKRTAWQKEKEQCKVVGVDNMNDYYDVRLKEWRLAQLQKKPNFEFHNIDIEDYDSLYQLFKKYSFHSSANSRMHQSCDMETEIASHSPFHSVINLAARAGVRYSLENPFIYYTTNVQGNLNLLELCKKFGIRKYILASTSSLYAGQRMPFKEDLPANEPISPYAASKKSAEVTCYTYHKLYHIDVSILRYFTVYGPASRPDMCPLRFISWIDRGQQVTIFGDGMQLRDFTYVDDIAQGTIAALKPLGFEIINLGGNEPIKLMGFLNIIEKHLNRRAHIVYEPTHPSDMFATWADISKAKRLLGWKPEVKIENGIESSIKWYFENGSLAAFIKL
jgi:UDP-glucuronate 4-epimerase